MARADLGSDLYGDIRDVVEDLIQSEVTTSVVATLKARSPALGFYMHGTLERLASPYWGSLGRTLKSDLTVLVSDFVYWHMSSGGGDGDILGSAKRFFHCAIDTTSTNPECVRLRAAIVTQNRSLLEATVSIKGQPDAKIPYWVLEAATKDLDTDRLSDDAAVRGRSTAPTPRPTAISAATWSAPSSRR